MPSVPHVDLGYASPMEQTAKFFVGQIVHHKKFDYRGVIFDVDATFRGTDEWYEKVARSRPPKHLPWYHVLVDGAETEPEARRPRGGKNEYRRKDSYIDKLERGDAVPEKSKKLS